MPIRPRLIATLTIVLVLIAGCGTATPVLTHLSSPDGAAPTPIPATATRSSPAGAPSPAITPTVVDRTEGLTEEEAATLNSLEQVDDYPLYTMRYVGSYERAASAIAMQSADRPVSAARPAASPAWACSLFAAMGDAANRLYGRNFDWEWSPALLLFTDPPQGYASVSMVDMAYLGFWGSEMRALLELSLSERRRLLAAPLLPFDGMNEQGLVVGMAAVPPGDVRSDPAKATVGSLEVIRQMLDRASNVDEAVAILQSYNVDMSGGPPVHYLLADRSGRSALVEFYQGEMVVIPNQTSWHLATNFLRASVQDAQGQCWRYDKLSQALAAATGQLSQQEVMDLLAAVSQPGTHWSIVYGMNSGDIEVAMGQAFEKLYRFHLAPARE